MCISLDMFLVLFCIFHIFTRTYKTIVVSCVVEGSTSVDGVLSSSGSTSRCVDGVLSSSGSTSRCVDGVLSSSRGKTLTEGDLT